MASFSEFMQKAVDDGVVIGAVLAAKDKSGKVFSVGESLCTD
jgi:hypothetical protein